MARQAKIGFRRSERFGKMKPINKPPRTARRPLPNESMQSILTINGGSSSIKFALYQAGEPLKRGLLGKVDRIGLSGTNLTFNNPTGNQQDSRSIAASDHKSAANSLIDWLEVRYGQLAAGVDFEYLAFSGFCQCHWHFVTSIVTIVPISGARNTRRTKKRNGVSRQFG